MAKSTVEKKLFLFFERNKLIIPIVSVILELLTNFPIIVLLTIVYAIFITLEIVKNINYSKMEVMFLP